MDSAGDILKALLIRHDLIEKGSNYSSLFKGWGGIVGPPLMDHSRIIDIKNAIMLIEVDHPGWLQILHFKKRLFLKKLKGRYPELDIKDLHIKVNLNFSVLQPDRKNREKRKIENPEIDSIVSHVKEDELKGLLKNLFVSALERQSKKEDS